MLINNAGLGGTANVVDMTDEQWSAVIDITLTGTFRMTRAVLPHMIRAGCGAIVNNASVLGWRAQHGPGPLRGRESRRDGADALHAALEAAESGVRINAVAPEPGEPPVSRQGDAAGDVLDELEAARSLRSRAAEPWEVANVMVFLASDYASYMTGECVSVSSQRA